MSKLIGLVTVLYNSEDCIEGFLKSALSQNYPNYKIYLIDNSDNEKSYEIIKSITRNLDKKNFIYIKNSENFGVAKGNNIGISEAIKDGCQSILLLNNDIEFYDKEIFTKITNLSNSFDIIFSKILYYNSNVLWYCGGYISKIFGNGIHKNINKVDDCSNNYLSYTEYGPTCFVLINVSVFNKIGMMDEKYFVYYDDLDFMTRAKAANIAKIYDPSLVIYHKVSLSTGGARSLFSLYYNSRNSIYYIKKNYFGLYKLFLLCSYTSARLIQGVLLSSKQRSEILRGLNDGYKM